MYALLKANALQLPLPDGGIHCTLAVPPWWTGKSSGSNPTIWPSNPPSWPHPGGCCHQWEKATCKNCGAWYGVLGAEPTFSLYVEHLAMVLREVDRVMTGSGWLWLSLGGTQQEPVQAKAAYLLGGDDSPWVLRDQMVLTTSDRHDHGEFMEVQHEVVLLLSQRDFSAIYADTYLPGAWNTDGMVRRPFGPFTPWPDHVVRVMLEATTREGDTVLDLFSGSAVGVRKAIEMGRHAVGVDMAYGDMSLIRTQALLRSLDARTR